MSIDDSEFEHPEETDEDEEYTYTIVVGEVPEPGTPGTEELSVIQRPHKHQNWARFARRQNAGIEHLEKVGPACA